MLLRVGQRGCEALCCTLLWLDMHIAEVCESEHSFGRRRDLGRGFLSTGDRQTQRQSWNSCCQKVPTFDGVCLFVHDTTISRRCARYE